MHNVSLLDGAANDAVSLNSTRSRNVDNLLIKTRNDKEPSPAASKKRESEQRKERELFSWRSPFPLGGESERAIFAFVTLVCCKYTIDFADEKTIRLQPA